MANEDQHFDFLQKFRDAHGNQLTDQDIMNLLDISKDKWYAYKKNLGKVPYDVLIKLSEIFGVRVDEIINYQPPKFPGVNPECGYEPNIIQENLTTKIDNSRISRKTKKELKSLVKKACAKPKIAILGTSDAGKTALTNYLLGGESKLKQAYTATTSSKTYIISSKDRPENIRDDALILEGYDIDLDRLSDDDYLKEKLIASGTSSMIEDYCTHFGEQYEKYKDAIITAVLYSDRPLLDVCILVDSPGFGTGNNSNDDKIAFDAKDEADAVIFLSTALSFMDEKDQTFVKSCIKTLKSQTRIKSPLNNLFVLASQAQIVNGGDKKELERILDSGCDKLYSDSADCFWQETFEQPIEKSELRSRFYSFSTNKDNSAFIEDFIALLKQMPDECNKKAKKTILNHMDDILLTSKKEYERLSRALKKYLLIKNNQFDDSESRAVDFFNQNIVNNSEFDKMLNFSTNDAKDQQKRLLEEIDSFNIRSQEDFTDKYDEIINVGHIKNVIDEKGLKRKKADYQRLSSILQDELNANLDEILTEYSKEFSDKVNDYLKNFEKETIKTSEIVNGDIGSIFNVKGAFASALAGVATYGGLAFWAATCGNLGGYILIAKGVSVLSSLGISIAGGTATVISAVSAIGGPITLGIAIALIAAIGVFGIFSKSKSWQKTLAGKIVKEFNRKDVYGKYIDIINTYWEDTCSAFKSASDSLIEECDTKIKEQNKIIQESNENELRKITFEAESAYRHLTELYDEIANDLK